MPIGKNSIKRVANGGYANLKSTAPDMENSTVEEKITATAPEARVEAPKIKAEAPKTQTKRKPKAPNDAHIDALKAEVEKIKESAAKTRKAKAEEQKIAKEAEADHDPYVGIGEDMPIYLL